MSLVDFLNVYRQLFTNYLTHVASFTAFKSKYTEQYGAELLELVNETLKIPNFQQRLLPGISLRELNEQRTREYLQRFAELKSYIDTAFPENAADMKVEAGAGYVRAARTYKWPKIQKMIVSVKAFLTTHAARLEAEGFMPASFSTETIDAGQTLDQGIFDYSNTKTKRPDKTKELTDKMKAILAAGKMISRDGKLIFKNSDIKRRLFILSHIKTTVLGAKAGGIKIWVRDVDEALLQPGVSIHISALGFVERHYMTDENGFVKVHPIESGTYTVVFSKPGFVTRAVEWKVKTSVSGRLKVMLEREVVEGSQGDL